MVSERQRQEWLARKAEVEAYDAAEREQKERPIREAAAAVARTHGEVLKLERQRVLTTRDDDFVLADIDPAMVNVRMSIEQAGEYNGRTAEQFAQQESRYYPCPENLERLLDYLYEKNGLRVISVPMWQAAFNRLYALGLMVEGDADPEPDQSEPIESPAIQEEHEGFPSRQAPAIEYVEGWDSVTGAPLRLTRYQVDCLPADQFQKFLRIPRVTNIDRRRE